MKKSKNNNIILGFGFLNLVSVDAKERSFITNLKVKISLALMTSLQTPRVSNCCPSGQFSSPPIRPCFTETSFFSQIVLH